MTVVERGRQHADVIWLDCIGGIPRVTPAPREVTGKYARLAREIGDSDE